MWPAAAGRLLLATSTGVEIVNVSNPLHPRLIKRLPQRAELVRFKDNLLALYDRATGITIYDYATLREKWRFNSGEEISDMQISGGRLYVSGSLSGLLVLDISNGRRPTLKAAYPSSNRTSKLSEFSGTVFMAGNEALVSVRLLPDVTATPGKQGSVMVNVPPQLPLGSYHLLALNAQSGKRAAYFDVLRAAMPVPKTTRFNMQDFERAMRDLGLNPAPHQ